MKQIEGIIRTVSPVHLGTGRSQGTFLPTLDYIPGRTIRGMLGYYLFKKNRELFNKSGIGEYKDPSKIKIHFRNAYPVSKEGETVCSPLSLKWCKRCNSLMDEDDFFCRKKGSDGSSCLHEGKKRTGFISDTSFSTGIFQKPDEIRKTITTKCPIIRGTHTSPGSADDGYDLSPYHIQAIAKGQKFRFRILVNSDDEAFVNALQNALVESSLYAGLGGFRSRGYGIISFEDLLSRNLADFVGQRREQLEPLNGSNAVLVMNAPLILRNGNDSVIGFNDKNQTFQEKANAVLTTVHATTQLQLNDQGKVTLGWDIARGWSLEKENPVDELIPCISAGSTIPICITDTGVIAALEVFGLGEMTYCGYGQVYCIPDFASQKKEVNQ